MLSVVSLYVKGSCLTYATFTLWANSSQNFHRTRKKLNRTVCGKRCLEKRGIRSSALRRFPWHLAGKSKIRYVRLTKSACILWYFYGGAHKNRGKVENSYEDIKIYFWKLIFSLYVKHEGRMFLCMPVHGRFPCAVMQISSFCATDMSAESVMTSEPLTSARGPRGRLSDTHILLCIFSSPSG